MVNVIITNLIFVVDVRVWQLTTNQLKQHHTKCINIGLKGVWVWILHPDHLGCLKPIQNVVIRKRMENVFTTRFHHYIKIFTDKPKHIYAYFVWEIDHHISARVTKNSTKCTQEFDVKTSLSCSK